jgi:hypothetical protein
VAIMVAGMPQDFETLMRYTACLYLCALALALIVLSYLLLLALFHFIFCAS